MNFTTLARGFGAASFLLTLPIALAQPYVISTLAGGVPAPTPTTAVSASVTFPSGVAADNSGNTYFTSDNSVFKVDAGGTLTRVAGNSRAGFSGDTGPAINAQLNAPYGLSVDASGSLFIADSGNHRIRKVSGGMITTVAGNGTAGFSGDSGPAISAQLFQPLSVAVDSSGNLYIADSYNKRIRKVVPGGAITTIAGDGTCCFSGDNGPAAKAQLYQPEGVAVDSQGNLYISDLGNNRIRKVTPAGIITTVAGTGANGFSGDGGPAISAQLFAPLGIAVDASGNLYIADSFNQRIRKVTPGGTITTVAGTSTNGFSGDGAAADKAQLYQPSGVSVDASGNLFIADTTNSRIRKVTASGVISTIAGNGTRSFSGDNGPAAKAQMYSPQAIAVGPAGSLYVTDYARVRQISPSGVITTVAGDGTARYFGDGGPAANAEFSQPEGIAIDASGNLYIADSANNRVRKVTTGGTITTVAGVGNGGYSGDRGPANNAQLTDPQGVAIDASGNLYIADSGNAAIRKVTPAGTITTVAGNGTPGFSGDGGPATSAQLFLPRGVAVDAAGNLYIADFGNSRLRMVSAAGTITTIAGIGTSDSSGNGGPAISAGISPQGVTVDASGNVYIADLNNLLWKLSPNGNIVKLAGTGIPGYSGDGGDAAAAQVTDLRSVAVDNATGYLYLADTSNYAIRFLRPVAVLLSITTPSPLPSGSVSAPYSQQLVTAGGTAPLSWSLVSGALPAGLALSATGTISGTPTTTGTSTFTLQVSDAAGLLATQSFSLTISVPVITTISTLLQGTVGLSYSQTLSATGGALPYSWTVTSGALPQGLSLSSSGVITGTPTVASTANFTVKVTDAASNSSTQSFTLVVIDAPPLARSGILGHIAAGGSPPFVWTTTIYLANTTSNQVAVSLILHADDGSALTLPMTVTQGGATRILTAPSLNTVISPNSTLVVDTGQQVAATVTGWVDVLTSGPVNGFAIFRTGTDASGSEGTSPLQTQFQSRIDVPYDNRAGFITAVALANLSNTTATITATIWDPTGKQLAVQSLTLPASGHTSFLFPSQFPDTAGKQGLVQFQSSAGGLGGIGLRASPQGTFTSVPVIQP